MRRLVELGHPVFPVTIYYAFKQSEDDGADGTTSTGWETFLDAVVRAGFAIDGTWPMRTENRTRLVGMDTNALASSIVLVCRQRAADAPTATRRDFITALKTELPLALAHLQRSNIAPVDLAQAAIGPGMAVFTRYSKVLDAGGKPLAVRDALSLINQTLDEVLAQQEGDFDADSRWALAWFEQQGFAEGEYGVAETLSSAKNTSVAGLVEAGFLASGRGKVRLLKPAELSNNWDFFLGFGPTRELRIADRDRRRLPPHPRARRWRRDSRRCPGEETWQQGRGGTRAGLPALHHVRAQETCTRGPGLQRLGAKLARNLPPVPRERRVDQATAEAG